MAIIRKDNKHPDIDPLDANKSTLTHRITALVSAHLAIMGCKPIETEVPIAKGWIADVASFTYPTNTELKQSKLLKVMPLGLDMDKKSWAQEEYFRYKYAFPLTVVVEIKISLADLKKDWERKFQQHPAHLCYIAFPNYMVQHVSELFKDDPNGQHYYSNCFGLSWGRIICSDDGERIIKIMPPRIVPQNPGDMIDFIAQVAIRRDHRTRYRYTRDMLKAYRKNSG